VSITVLPDLQAANASLREKEAASNTQHCILSHDLTLNKTLGSELTRIVSRREQGHCPVELSFGQREAAIFSRAGRQVSLSNSSSHAKHQLSTSRTRSESIPVLLTSLQKSSSCLRNLPSELRLGPLSLNHSRLRSRNSAAPFPMLRERMERSSE
jgi:hypothetical protein